MDLLATAQNRAAALAVSELEAAWAKTGSVNDPAALRDLLVEMMPSITRRYGGIAATAAAQWYDAVRATEVQADGFKAQADTQDDAADAAAGSARWAATPLFDGVDGAARAAAVDRAGEAVDRLVRESGRMTLESNARRDPAAKRWMIVPQGVTCAWCAMLASRGAAYLSEKTAAKSVHAHCDCQVVPDFGKGVQGFSAKPYMDLYDRARAEVGGDASAGEVLAVMRRLPGVGLSDGVGGRKPPRSGGGSGSGSSGGGNPPGGGNGHGSGSAGDGWRVPHSPNEERILSLRGCGDVTDEEWRRRQEAVGVPGSVEALYPQEIVFLEKFENLGNHVEWIPRDTERWKSTNDFRWIEQGEEFELKSMTGDKYKHIAGRISSAVRSAHENHGVIKDCFVVDIGGVEAKQKLIHQLERYNVNNAANGTAVRRLFLMDSTGLREIHLE